MVRKTLQQLKQEYPHIRYTVVSACVSAKRRKSDCPNHVNTLFLEELENTPRRDAIYKRNHWMITQADTVITYVTHTIGRAVQFKGWLKRKENV